MVELQINGCASIFSMGTLNGKLNGNGLSEGWKESSGRTWRRDDDWQLSGVSLFPHPADPSLGNKTWPKPMEVRTVSGLA